MIRLLMLVSAVFGIGYGYAISHDVWPFEGMDANQRGVFGDSWGAFTSIFSAMGFCGVLWTIKLQMDATKKIEEESSKREEAEKIRDFESSFFNMLNILQTLIKDMRVESVSGKTLAEGRHVFLYFFRRFKKEVKKKNGMLLDFNSNDALEVTKASLRMSNEYRFYFRNRAQNLSHYFRYIYNMFKIIHESDLNSANKKKYANILRAQLSNYELLMLFYNANFVHGRKFEAYMNSYAVLDNLPAEKLINKKHVAFYDMKAWGENHDALKYHPYYNNAEN
ncbi:putative phage abortive infection protein [Lelliottia nimipressuralis]|uniref:putative phage abortive infection protein n=1 Tax=Lelliottia nimipressuralis TaxID=69220 RepID=UPI00289FFD9C|nr:putative phage abortive infection protein [Lelliottia nimipressuralis]